MPITHKLPYEGIKVSAHAKGPFVTAWGADPAIFGDSYEDFVEDTLDALKEQKIVAEYTKEENPTYIVKDANGNPVTHTPTGTRFFVTCIDARSAKLVAGIISKLDNKNVELKR